MHIPQAQAMVQRQPQQLSIVPDGHRIHNEIAQASANVRAGLTQSADDINSVNHGGAHAPGAATTPGFTIPGATPNEKTLMTAYSNILSAFENGQITGDMLASDKALALYLEQALQWEQRFYQLMANISKLKHETMQGIIGNLRG